MSGSYTIRDLATDIGHALESSVGDYDVDAIAVALRDMYGLRRLDEYDDEAFWSTAVGHALEDHDRGQEFRDELSAAIKATEIGGVALWSGDGVEVEVRGAPRANPSWPAPGAQVKVTVGGKVYLLDGWTGIASWDDLWEQIDAWTQDAEISADAALSVIVQAQHRLGAAEHAVTVARARRDDLIREASAAGVTAYRIAKRLGVAESTVGRVLR